MKATTVAAAAAFLGSVSAEGWEGWSSSEPVESTASTPVKITSTTPVKETTTPAKPTGDETTWSEWSTTTSSKPVEITSTTSAETTWSEWSTTTSSKPVEITSTTSAEHTWSEWESSSSSTPVKITSTTSSEPEHTWSEWESSSTPVKITSTTSAAQTWSEWEPTETITSTSTQWITVTVFPADGGSTWSEWSTPVASTTTDSKTVVVSSTVTKTAESSWEAWSSASTPVIATATDSACKMAVSVSYGPAVWYPTPVIAASANTTWGEWETATSSTPVKVSTTTPAADESTWAVWSSTTSSKPVEITSTASSTWGEWSTTSSKPVEIISTASSTWGEWSTTSSKPVEIISTSSAAATWSAWSQSEGGNSYTASKTGSAGGSSSTGITSNGNKFGITYSPYTSNSGCKDAATVESDIASIAGKGFTSVRVYSTDCETLENVGTAARNHGIKVILGVFISETGISGAKPQVDDIVAWAQWDLVELIVVGNEAVFNGRCSASELAGFIASSKAAFQGAGYTGAVSTTDELSVWQGQGSAWCDSVDVVTANLYAFFNAEVTADMAGDFIQRQINDLSQVCPGKEVYIMESGWPSAGECNGAACPSPENQATAIHGIQQAAGAKVVFFSFEDEQWKQPGKFGVEQHWGCAEVF